MATSRNRTSGKKGQHRTEPDPLAAKVGARVRQLRLEKSFSFDEFVAETELGRGYISELERGLVVPTVGALSRVAETLDVTLLDLVTFPDDDPRQEVVDLSRHFTNTRLRGLVKEMKTYLSDRKKGG